MAFGYHFCDKERVQISYLFKLYPWEWMLKDKFAPYLLKSDMIIFEPAWRMVLQNKNMMKKRKFKML